jgi:hypothetical protein
MGSACYGGFCCNQYNYENCPTDKGCVQTYDPEGCVGVPPFGMKLEENNTTNISILIFILLFLILFLFFIWKV